MNEIQIFENMEFGEIRTTLIDDAVWFVAKDVAEKLGYKNTRDAVLVHTSKDDRANVVIHDSRQGRKMNVINESGLYCLIFGSKMEDAVKFKLWVTKEILPSVRKYGGFIATKFGDTEEDIIERAKKILKATLEEKDSLIQQQALTIDKTKELIRRLKPFYEVTRAIRDREGLLTLEMVSKLLYDNDNRIGRNTFIGILRDMKLLNQNNLPYQKYINSGHFRVKFKRLSKTDEFYSVPVTLVTGKGVVYLTNRILKEFKNPK